MPAGRPTEYSKDILKKAEEYCLTYENLDEVVPSVEGLSHYIKIAKSTIYEWVKQEGKEEFSDIVNTLLSIQGKIVLNKGLKGQFNSKIAGMLLSKHGYYEKQDITSNEEPIKLNVISYANDNDTPPVQS